jgi:hypothetical protein
VPGTMTLDMKMIISKEEENPLNKEDQKLKPQNGCS